MFSALMHSVDVEFLKTHPLPLPFDTPEDITVSRDHTGTQYNIEFMHICEEFCFMTLQIEKRFGRRRYDHRYRHR